MRKAEGKEQLIEQHLPIKMILTYFKRLGYDTKKVDGQEWYKITGNDIYGYIVLDNFYRETRDYPYLYADHVDCFDKENKCPISIRLPKTPAELEYLAERLRFWGSREGFKITNSFDHHNYDSNEYPRKSGGLN